MERLEGKDKELEKLVNRATAVLNLSDLELRKKFVKMAEENTPTRAYDEALLLASKHFDVQMAIGMAKACRHLAIIKRDFGINKFQAVIS